MYGFKMCHLRYIARSLFIEQFCYVVNVYADRTKCSIYKILDERYFSLPFTGIDDSGLHTTPTTYTAMAKK